MGVTWAWVRAVGPVGILGAREGVGEHELKIRDEMSTRQGGRAGGAGGHEDGRSIAAACSSSTALLPRQPPVVVARGHMVVSHAWEPIARGPC